MGIFFWQNLERFGLMAHACLNVESESSRFDSVIAARIVTGRLLLVITISFSTGSSFQYLDRFATQVAYAHKFHKLRSHFWSEPVYC